MKILLAGDHAGFALKLTLAGYLREKGFDVEDMGPHSLDEEDDYPDYILPLARALAQQEGDFGIIVGGSGQGEAMAANRVPYVRTALYYGGSLDIVRLSRQHNDANILSLGARFLTDDEAKEAVILWLTTAFSGDERHVRRIRKIDE